MRIMQYIEITTYIPTGQKKFSKTGAVTKLQRKVIPKKSARGTRAGRREEGGLVNPGLVNPKGGQVKRSVY